MGVLFLGKVTIVVNGEFGESKTNKSEDIEATNRSFQFGVSTGTKLHAGSTGFSSRNS